MKTTGRNGELLAQSLIFSSELFRKHRQIWRAIIFWSKPMKFVCEYGSLISRDLKNVFCAVFRQYYKKHRYVGTFNGLKPVLLITDPALVKDIFVNYFKNFGYNTILDLVNQIIEYCEVLYVNGSCSRWIPKSIRCLDAIPSSWRARHGKYPDPKSHQRWPCWR